MPTPEEAAIISSGLNTISQAGAVVAQARLNKKTREWNEKMYGVQRADALADWTRQNEYNHPSAQMARLREAGLNPNLVYGKGADNTASAVRSGSTGSWSPRAADIGAVGSAISGGLMNYYDVQMKQAQIDNFRVQNTVLAQDAALKAATTANVSQQTKKGEFDLGLANDLRTTSLDMAREQLRKLQTGIDVDLQENERKAAMNSANLLTAAENVLKIRAERANTEAERRRINTSIDNLRKDARLKDLDIELKKNGIQPSDNIFMRILGRLLGGVDIKDLRPTIEAGGFKESEWHNGRLK